MTLLYGIIVLLLTSWCHGQAPVDLVDPNAGTLNVGTGGTVNTGFNRRTIGDAGATLNENTNTQGTNTGVGGADNNGAGTFSGESTVVRSTNTGILEVNNAGGGGGTSSLFVDGNGIITGRADSSAEGGTTVVNAGGTFGGDGVNTRTDVSASAVNLGGTLPGPTVVSTQGDGTNTRVNFGNNIGASVDATTGTVGATGEVVGTGTRVNNFVRNNGGTNTFSAGTGGNAALDRSRVNNVAVNTGTERNTVGVSATVGVNTGNRRGGNTGGTATVNVGGTIGGTGRNNVRTTTSGGTVNIGNRESLSASAQNLRPRLPDVSHAECEQGCLYPDITSNHCVFASKTDCQQFVICYKLGLRWYGYSYFCPFGKFWYDQACVGFADYQCQYDRCAVEPQLRSYRDRSLQYVDPSLKNCRTFWQCQNGRSAPYCCPVGQGYREGLGCVEDLGCRDWCCPKGQIFVDGIGCREMSHAICFEKCCPADADYGSCVADHICLEDCVRLVYDQSVEKGCPYEVVEGDTSHYYVRDGGRVTKMPCPSGLVFMKDKCSCVQGSGAGSSTPVINCRPNVHMDFNNGSTENLMSSKVDLNNVKSVNNYGQFVRGSRGIVPYYRSNDGVLHSIYIKLRFFDSNQYTNDGRLKGPRQQVLVSNCQTQDSKGTKMSPSLAILLQPREQTLTFIGITDLDKAMFRIPYNRKGWNNVIMAFNGTDLYGRVENEDSQKANNLKVLEQKRPLQGHLKHSLVGLSFGSCGATDFFQGFLDEILIFDCIPSTI